MLPGSRKQSRAILRKSTILRKTAVYCAAETVTVIVPTVTPSALTEAFGVPLMVSVDVLLSADP